MTLMRLRDACQRARVGAATRRQGADADSSPASMGRSSRKQGDERPVMPPLTQQLIDLRVERIDRELGQPAWR